MALFGKKKPAAKKSAPKSKSKSTKTKSAKKNDAAEIAKKMKEKSASGECAFC